MLFFFQHFQENKIHTFWQQHNSNALKNRVLFFSLENTLALHDDDGKKIFKQPKIMYSCLLYGVESERVNWNVCDVPWRCAVWCSGGLGDSTDGKRDAKLFVTVFLVGCNLTQPCPWYNTLKLTYAVVEATCQQIETKSA